MLTLAARLFLHKNIGQAPVNKSFLHLWQFADRRKYFTGVPSLRTVSRVTLDPWHDVGSTLVSIEQYRSKPIKQMFTEI
jgi:hypothetical protein